MRLFLAFCLILLAGPALACTAPTPSTNQMAIVSPCSPTLVTANQKTAAALTNIAISDSDAMLLPNSVQEITVDAPGMVNVEVWVHGVLAARLTNNGSGIFTGCLNTSSEKSGPLPIAIFAWNSVPGDNSYTVNLAARDDIIICPGYPYTPSTPAGASGMTLKWTDNFNIDTTLSIAPCAGTYPCVPTAETATWYPNKPGGGDFGDAAFEHTDGTHNPYSLFAGGLRIRSTYDPTYVDPYGYSRVWYSGLLATGYSDGSSNTPTMGNGYYEARILVPYAATLYNNSASGGTWPAFWMVTSNSFTTSGVGDIEEDAIEQYGNDPGYTQSGQHVYNGATGSTVGIFSGYPDGDLTWDWHRYGLLITDTTISSYFDGTLVGSIDRAQLVGGVAPQWFLLINLALGGGWPVNPPPGGYFDMWVNYVSYYAP